MKCPYGLEHSGMKKGKPVQQLCAYCERDVYKKALQNIWKISSYYLLESDMLTIRAIVDRAFEKGAK